ncbi:MAG: hypothetical protein IPM69_17590 [Ignavibacteria bacterium]|nr:hypothetical protein [Ignavibacteria bacterium]
MKSTFLLLLIVLLQGTSISAQTIEDAVRYSTTTGYSTARAGAMGLSYSGISDDYAALYYNPAGLSLLTTSEFSVGLEFMKMNTSTNYLQTSTPLSSSFVSPTNCGFVFPFKINNGIAAIALGYNHEGSFDNTMEFTGFNTISSIVPSLMNETSDLFQNLAYQVFLADTIGGTGKLHSPITGNIQQSGFITERGGIHSFTAGVGISLSKSVSVGINFSGKSGSYTYSSEYQEFDKLNTYNFNDKINFSSVDFKSLILNSDIDQQFSGVNGTVGIQGRFDNSIRFGVTIKSPTFYRIEEVFSRTISATFDNGDIATPKYPENESSYNGRNTYDIITPFVFGASLSYHYQWITLSAAAEYNDLTQIQFDDALPELLKLNNQILKTLNGSFTYSIGTEVEIPTTAFILRAGYSGVSASYQNDIVGAEQSIIGLGAGVYLAPNIRLDLLSRFSTYSQPRANYGNGDEARYIYTVSPTQISVQFVYRY